MAGSGPRRPLLGLALTAALGCALGAGSPLPAWSWMAAGAGALVLTRILAGPARILPLWAALLLLFAAYGRLGGREAFLRRHDLLQTSGAESVELTGRVVSEPIPLAVDEDGRPRLGFDLRISGLRRLPQPEPASGRVRVRLALAPEGPVPGYGDRLTVSGVARRGPAGDLRLDAPAGGLIAHAHGLGNLWVRFALRGRTWARGRLALGLEDAPEVRAVVDALALGFRSGLPEEQEDLFARSGTLHIFAVSGLHVGMLGLLVTSLAGFLGVPRHRWIWALAPALGLFVAATGARPSATRALVMAIAFWGAPAIGRRPDAPSALALAVLLALLGNPATVLEPGFQFSFVAVAGILVITPVVLHPLAHRLGPDPWEVGRSRWRRWLRQARLYVLGLAATSVAAWFATAPLTARVFHQAAPAALLTNLAVIPGAFVVLLTAMLSLTTGLAADALSLVFNAANRALVEVLIRAAALGAALPGGHAALPAPGPLTVAAWYGLGVGAVALRGRARAATLSLCGMVVAAGLALDSPPGRTDMALLPRSGRLAVLIRPADGQAVVVLPDWAPDAEGMARMLRAQGVSRLRQVIVARDDAGTRAALDRLRREYGSFDTATAEDLAPGDSGWWPGQIGWEVVESDAASGLVVLRVQIPDRPSVLVWTGQAAPRDPRPADRRDWTADEVVWTAPPGRERPSVGLWQEIGARRVRIPVSGRRDAQLHADRLAEELAAAGTPLERVPPRSGPRPGP